MTVGLPGAVEVGLGISVVRPRPVTLATADLLPTAKWQLWADPAMGRAVAVAALAFLPFARRTPEKIPTDAYGFAFVAASTTAPVLRRALVGERAQTVTVAAFEKVGRGRAWLALNDESRRGVMLALDQPLPRTLTRRAGADALGLSLNWVSGQTVFGYAAAAVVAARGAWQGSMGYARGNRPTQNHGPQVALGRSW